MRSESSDLEALEVRSARHVAEAAARAGVSRIVYLGGPSPEGPASKHLRARLATGDTFKELGRSPLGEGTHSTPCVDGGRIYVKTFTHLVCIAGK